MIKMQSRVRFLFDFDLKIHSGKACATWPDFFCTNFNLKCALNFLQEFIQSNEKGLILFIFMNLLVRTDEDDVEADDKIRRAYYFRHKSEQEGIHQSNFRISIEDPTFRLPGIQECYQFSDNLNDKNVF